MKTSDYPSVLSGGKPNSLGRTLEVVEHVMADKRRLKALLDCYSSDDELVRLRVSNAVKRVSREHPAWLVHYTERLLNDISKIDQASTQWTLAELFDTLKPSMSAKQHQAAKKHLKKLLASHDDWIVLNTVMKTLAQWADTDKRLANWLLPHLQRLADDPRKSVSNRARKLLAALQ